VKNKCGEEESHKVEVVIKCVMFKVHVVKLGKHKVKNVLRIGVKYGKVENNVREHDN